MSDTERPLPPLDDESLAVARAVAGVVVDALKPGCTPAILPEWVADLFRHIGKNGGHQCVSPVYLGGAHVVMLHSWIRPDGSLMLQLEVDGQYRAWEGVLRGPGVGP